MQIKPPIIINASSSGNAYASLTNRAISTAIGDNVTDAQPQLQSDIDYCIANGITELFFPYSDYKLNKGLVVYANNSSGGYAQVTLKLRGRGSMWDSFNTTVFHGNFTDGFVINIQRGKGVTIEGIAVDGKYNPPVVDDKTFYNRELSDCTDGVCGQSRYFPNCGIAIDYFSNGQIPADGGLPGWISWYKGDGGTSGSTATEINKCIITNFPVGIVSSANGFTSNAEITTISNTKFSNCPLWISGGQAQEKANRIINAAGWNDTHTCFATGVYGAGTPGNWFIDTVSIAGRCNRFINNFQGGFFPSYVNNVYAEGLGTFGYMGTGYLGTRVSDSNFNFVSPSISGYQKSYITADFIKFDACNFRHYGSTYAIPIRTNKCVFTNCGFTGIPLQPFEGSNPGSTSQFFDCIVSGKRFGVQGVSESYLGYGSNMYTYGNWTLEDNNLTRYGIHLRLSGKTTDTYARIATDNSVTVSLSSNSFTFTTSTPNIYSLNRAVLIAVYGSADYYFGIVSNISGSTITISNCSSGLTNGSNYRIYIFHPLTLTTFIGDISAGTNQITNVKSGWGGYVVGDVFQSSYSNGKWIKILAITGSTYTVSENMTATKTGAYFGGNTTQEISSDNTGNIFTNSAISNIIVRKGDIIKQGGNADNSTSYTVTTTGIINPTDGDTRVATWQ